MHPSSMECAGKLGITGPAYLYTLRRRQGARARLSDCGNDARSEEPREQVGHSEGKET
jgi:hypothetical protein